MRIAVIGDVGGHAKQLHHELARLGARPDGSLPEDLIVVQVGDLIHRGPDSARVVNTVDHYLRTQPTQWVQLIGNHEAHYLQPPVFLWPETLSRTHIRILNRWWQDGAATVAAAVETTYESFLITHAGITAEFWASDLGGPPTAAEAARRINDLAKSGVDTVFRAGTFLHGIAAPDAGPLWADATTELFPGWADRRMPFSQIHGHNSITTWRGDDNTAPRTGIDALVTIDLAAKHETVHLAGGRLIGIDPDHRDTPTTSWHALELTGTVTAR
ncbi:MULTISPECIES: metallophosphoesterase [unclassified Mycobacterium]|uniref:metallophosphoesterase n=1 Tax=unclassified Mycobacterium TaxID=2642494 RepID=UPI0029C914B5|nr:MULTISPECIES: metallophosphoesterase [unclassified Mycobacterium]